MPETTAPTGAEPAPDLVAELAETSEGRQCTLYPADADDAALVTTWITADADAFVALADAR